MPLPALAHQRPGVFAKIPLRCATHTGPHCSAVFLGTPHSGDRAGRWMAAGSAPPCGIELGPEQRGTRCCCSCCPGCCCCGSRIGSSWDCPSRPVVPVAAANHAVRARWPPHPNRFITCRRHDRLHAGSVNATSACIRCCNSNSVPRPAIHSPSYRRNFRANRCLLRRARRSSRGKIRYPRRSMPKAVRFRLTLGLNTRRDSVATKACTSRHTPRSSAPSRFLGDGFTGADRRRGSSVGRRRRHCSSGKRWHRGRAASRPAASSPW